MAASPSDTPGVPLGLGRPALPEEIAAWDVDILPDGRGLPAGSGDVTTGEEIFVERCGSCHGDFAEGVDNWPVLAGGFDTLGDEDPVKTVGSYWPHLSTVWDYISRSMPFGDAGTLTPDETYAIVAYILFSNDMVDDDFVLSNGNFLDVEMHNRAGFVIDDRPEQEYANWRAEPCMKNCKEEARVTMRSVFLVNEPPEGGTESVMNDSALDGLPTFSKNGPSFTLTAAKPVENKPAESQTDGQPVETETETQTEAKPAEIQVANAEPAGQQTAAAAGDPELIKAGEKVFKKCKACHQVGEGAKNRIGPLLNGIVNGPMGAIEGFKYSTALMAKAAEGATWNEENLHAFLTKPKKWLKGTKMAFGGLKKEKDRNALIEYLRSAGN
ncbi:MAG: c-type cytochrome [Pseudomonadota bacterium]